MNLLQVKNINKDYGEFKLKNISLSIPKGYIYGYIGQNGAGKTTTLDIIMGFKSKDTGKVLVDNLDQKQNEEQYLDSIGYVSDECYFPEVLTIVEIKELLQSFYNTFNSSVFDKYMKKWKISYKKKIKELSKGMQTKVMLASVLARETKILVLDEPTSGLDPIFRHELLELMQAYIEDGQHSVLFSTHIMDDLEQVVDYVYFIHEGKMILANSKEIILEEHRMVKGDLNQFQPIEKILIGAKKSKMGFEGLIKKADTLRLQSGMLIERPTLEEIMLYYTKRLEKENECA